jgi:hypothetical protein
MARSLGVAPSHETDLAGSHSSHLNHDRTTTITQMVLARASDFTIFSPDG